MLRFTGGSIVTMDPDNPVGGEVVTRGNQFAWVGRRGDCPVEYRRAQTVDLKHRLLLPAFSDAHAHFLYFAQNLTEIDLDGVRSLRAAQEKIRRPAANPTRGRWLTGRGFDVNLWGGHWPTRDDLDHVVPDRPAAIFSHDEHSLWVNSAALRLAQIDRSTPDPLGGRIGRTTDGEPNGMLYETAYRLVWDLVPKPTPSQAERLIETAQSKAHGVGVTAIHDMGDPAILRACLALKAKGKLRLRLWKSIPLAELDRAIGLGLHSGLGDEWVKIGGVKIFLDGALGSQTAWLYKPYSRNPDSRGICRMERGEFDDAVRRAAAHGLSVCVHAIGDAAVGQAIDVLSKYHLRFPKNQRPRIEHLQMIDPADLKKLAGSGIIASMQPSHLLTDRDPADRHWGKRAKNAFVFRTLWDAGVTLAFGSDVPIERISPLEGIGAAVHRARPDDRRGPWYPKQRLSVWEAVWGFTVGAAIAASEDDRRGQIVPGQQADLVVLDGNIFTAAPKDIFSTRVVMTFIDGVRVHNLAR